MERTGLGGMKRDAGAKLRPPMVSRRCSVGTSYGVHSATIENRPARSATREKASMAKVFQIIQINDDKHFESALVNGAWHFGIHSDAARTVCGIQLEGDDGIAAGPERDGTVTCLLCREVISQIKALDKW